MPTITNTSSFAVTVKASKAGYKTQTTTQTVRVNKAAGTLILSATSGTLMYPDTTTFTASGNKGTLSVVSSNTNVATVSISKIWFNGRNSNNNSNKRSDSKL